MSSVRILLVCTGIGVMNRGIETFAAECYNGLKHDSRLDLRLAATRITADRQTFPVWSLSRDTVSAVLLGKLIRRNSYVVEQLSSFVSVAKLIRDFRPEVVFTSEANLTFQLYRWREVIGVPFRLLFSNGGPCGPEFPRMDFIHQVAPYYTHLALDRGDPERRHITVPYGISTPAELPLLSTEDRSALRQRLGLPLDTPLLLCIGSVDRHHKRMDYLIREIAALPIPRPHLVILGHLGEQSRAIIEEAHSVLGPDRCTVRSVPYSQVSAYYQAADQFVLCSLREGFGRVLLEAAMYGLPVIAHRHPVMEYVVGSSGTLINLSPPGSLAAYLTTHPVTRSDPAQAFGRWQTIRKRFDWNNLRGQYIDMFRHAATTQLPWL